jgi:hypothetical protein
VSSFTPAVGATGGKTPVQIFGAGFTGASAVKFGSTAAASFTVKADNEIDAVAPAGSGSATISVVTSAGTLSSATKFVYQAPPAVTSLDETSGASSGIATTFIIGSNFTGATAVTLGGVPVTNFKLITANEIAVTANSPGAMTADFQVTTPAGTSAKSSADTWTGHNPATATTASPDSGPGAGGNQVTITGTNFVAGLTEVAVDGAGPPLPATVTSSTTLTVTLPAHADGSVTLYVYTPGMLSNSAPAADTAYTYTK